MQNKNDFFNNVKCQALIIEAKHFWVYTYISIGLVLIIFLSCTNKKDDPVKLPTIITLPITEIQADSAKCGGNITDSGGASITERGIVWNTSGLPTTGNKVGITSDGTGTGEFISRLKGLSSSVTYHLRAYATNSIGTAYGNEVIREKLFAGGSGKEIDPYLVETADQMDHMRGYLKNHFKLIANIDLSDYNSRSRWYPIGNGITKFSGTFDGNGYKITNLTINLPDFDYVGLFGLCDSSVIKNIALEKINIVGNNRTGGLVGGNGNGGVIIDSYATGNVKGNSFVGGLIGSNGGNITDSYATGNVTGNSLIGGLIGISSGDVIDCYTSGKVVGKADFVGGFIGYNDQGGITNCYAAGNVTGNTSVGGLVGYDKNGTIEHCYYDQNTTGQNDTGKGVSKTTIEMMQQATFENWDFAKTWVIDEGKSYPNLWWQK